MTYFFYERGGDVLRCVVEFAFQMYAIQLIDLRDAATRSGHR